MPRRTKADNEVEEVEVNESENETQEVKPQDPEKDVEEKKELKIVPVERKLEEKVNWEKGQFEFGFRFTQGMKVIEEATICGEGENEEAAITNAREKAEVYNNGRYTVVYTGHFKIKE